MNKRSASFQDDSSVFPPPCQLTEQESPNTPDFAAGCQRRDRKAPAISVKTARNKPVQIKLDPVQTERLMSAFGTVELGFAHLMLGGIINAACDGGSVRPPEEEDVNRALAAVAGIGARDETEAMLATQMVATHFAAMGVLRRLKGSETIPQQDTNGNLAVKLLRTFTMQVEALQRYRGKGQQKVTVEHVHVHAGGQAIVGAVTPGGGDARKSEEQVHAPHRTTHEPGTSMWSSYPEREAVPIAGRFTESVGVECMAEHQEAALRSATRTPSGMVITR